MKILADENIYEPIIVYLKDAGNEVISIREELSGVSDDEVYRRACVDKLILLTMDKDFSRTIRFPPEKCGGIIVVKIYKRQVAETLELFKKHFENIGAQDINGNLVIMTPDGFRIRRTAL